MAYTFNQINEEFQTARDKKYGKPFGNNTRIELVQGDAKAPTCLAIKYHWTDIIKFYKDGSQEVDTSYKTVSTLERIRAYSRINPYARKLPSFNGRRPSRESCFAFKEPASERIFVYEGVNDSIKINADGTVDLSTIKPIRAEIITDSKLAMGIVRKARFLHEQLVLRQKLGVTPKNEIDFTGWMLAHLGRPINEVDFSIAPPAPVFHCNKYTLARLVGATKEIELKFIN